MSESDSSPIDRLRQPEYTGENRCGPCTVLNVLIAVVLSAVLGRERKPLGAVVLALSLAAIYLRGYLVPGTPELTKRYLPESVHRRIGPDPVAERLGEEFVDDVEPSEVHGDRSATVEGDVESQEAGTGSAATTDAATGSAVDETDDGNGAGELGSDAADGDGSDGDADDGQPEFRTLEKMRRAAENEIEPEPFLRSAGVVEPADGDDAAFTDGLAFTDEFAADARERIPDDVEAVDPERLAPLFDVEPDELEGEDRDYPAYRVGVRIRKWPTAAAQALDVATFEAIAERSEEWAAVPIQQRLDVLEWLRGFYDECPACGGAVTFSDDVIESCCGQFDVTTLSCADCGVHLREFDPSKVGNRADLKGIVP